MKRLAATLLGICSMVASIHAQGVFNIDSGANEGNGSGPTATNGGLVFIDGVLDTTQDINLGVLWGTSSTTVTNALNIDPLGLNTGIYAGCGNWIASQPTGQGDMTSYGGGAIFDPNGLAYVVPGEAGGTTVYLILQGWLGSSPTAAGGASEGAESAPFSITLAVNTSPLIPNTSGMGSLDMPIPTPEPSTLALSSIGAAALMLVRRKK